MPLPNIHSQKWLSEIELLDTRLDPSSTLKPQNIANYFTELCSATACQQMKTDILSDMQKELEHTVSWFLTQMPPLYLWSTTQRTLMSDLLEIITCRVLSEKQMAEKTDPSLQTVTLIAAGEKSSASTILAKELSRFPAKSVRLFNSLDKVLGLCTLSQAPYSTNGSWTGSSDAQSKKQSLRDALGRFPANETGEFIDSLDADYCKTATVKQMVIAFQAINHCIRNENVFVNTTEVKDETINDARMRVDIGLRHFPVNEAAKIAIGIITRYQFRVRRLLANEIILKDRQKFTVLNIVVAAPDGKPIATQEKNWGKVLKNIKTLCYVDHDDEFSGLLLGEQTISLNEINLLRGLANWVHIFLTKQNAYSYSLDRVSKAIVNHQTYMSLCIQYFRARFDPKLTNGREQRLLDISQQIKATFDESSDPIEKNVLKEGFNFLSHILKTNYFLLSKSALTFRLDPRALDKKFYPETPFAIFYMIGRNFRAFQVRYRDIARGGMRIVLPRTAGEHESALAGLFDEVNGLASAQQLKNKDIPEGGSKLVMVVRPNGDKTESVKAAVSGLLDLVITDPVTGRLADGIVDYYGKEEIIYLGPDENLTNDLIVWTISHALHRGYRYAYAFMSSKPDFGINHKTYGVTSEGLNVYVDNVLEYLNLKGKVFRVKMTGGPDGDVGGNELHILHREYGENCRVVAIADGLGAAFDPNGLAWDELLRLFRAEKSIVHFDPQKLSPAKDAFVIDASTKEHKKIRDNLYATVPAEIFIPAGGRPYTVKESNWSNFLLPDGKPSSLAIVEGANIFFTPEARQKLVDSGVIVIKDSSANKAGVNCSSYEIIACLTLTPEEFSTIKDIYVFQVLQIIRQNAGQEARLLFREWKKNKQGTDLVKLSYHVSAEINSAKDILLSRLNLLDDDALHSERYQFILLGHCPQVLVEKYRERILTKLPRAHKIAILSASMASHLIYREGLDWLEKMDPEQVFQTALRYVEAERNIEKMAHELEQSQLACKTELIDVLRATGAKHFASRFKP